MIKFSGALSAKEIAMKNLPNLTGYLKAADNILGNLEGIAVLGIILALVVAVVGVSLAGFFFLTSALGIGINVAGYILIGILGILSILLLLIMVLSGGGKA